MRDLGAQVGFKDGMKDSNPAGMRISESVKQFSSLNKFPAEPLSGLLFYYELYNLENL